jgi:cyclic beta-1,2-glucan synthetase
VQLAVTLLFTRAPILRLNLDGGIPDECRTAVVVPALLCDQETTAALLASLEQHFRNNRDSKLRFVLLTDFVDAATEATKGDAELLENAVRGIEWLNCANAGHEGDIFFLLHRPRRWSQAQGAWMGWERKRGKLMDFNAFLLQGRSGSFIRIVGDARRLDGIKFVITLDADTGLPEGAARMMVTAMGHPSNRPVHDPVTGIVVGGYGMLQPRMVTRLDPGKASWRQLVTCEVPPPMRGLEPPSDADQCLFPTVAFFGKGIYDVAAFERALSSRLPSDWILSHDLLEGCYARCASLWDVELTEGIPENTVTELKRRHRWIRGDWQSAPWALPRVPLADGTWGRNPLSALSRWRILDNLRRTVWPGSMLALVLLCLGSMDSRVPLAMVMFTVYLLPTAIRDLMGVLRKDSLVSVSAHLAYWSRCVGRHLCDSVTAIMFLPVDAAVAASAIVVALRRMLLSKHEMLAWVASDRCERTSWNDLANYVKAMTAGPAMASLAWVLAGGATFSLAVAPLMLLWAMSPIMAWVMSRPARQADSAGQAARY